MAPKGLRKSIAILGLGVLLLILGVAMFIGLLGYSVERMVLGLPAALMGIALIFILVRRQEPSEGEDVWVMWRGRYPPLGRAPEEKEPTD